MWFTAESRQHLSRQLCPQFECPIYKVVFTDVCSLISGPKIMILIIPAQVAWFCACSIYISMPFLRCMLWTGRTRQLSAYSAPRFPILNRSTICKLGRRLLNAVYSVQMTFPVQSQHETPYSQIGHPSDCRLNFS